MIVCWFLCFPPNLPELNLKLFCSDVQNNFRFSAGKFREKHRNQQTITFTCQFLAEMNKIWSCFIFIKSCMRYHLFMHHGILKRLHPTNIYTTVVLTMLIRYLLTFNLLWQNLQVEGLPKMFTNFCLDFCKICCKRYRERESSIGNAHMWPWTWYC